MSENERAILMDIAGKVGKVEAAQEASIRATSELSVNINRLVDKLETSDNLAREANQSARSAHHRLDSLQNNEFPKIEVSMDRIRENQKWLIYIGVTGAGVFIAALAFIWSVVKH